MLAILLTPCYNQPCQNVYFISHMPEAFTNGHVVSTAAQGPCSEGPVHQA